MKKAAHLRVADVFRQHWAEYDRTHTIAPHQLNAVRHILQCRTAALGGHLHRCDACHAEIPLYNSCQTRHCPTCQASAREVWLDARRADLLPVTYFHCVFTLPHALNALIDANRRLLLDELFGTVAWVLQRFARDPQWRLQGQLGFTAVLHTWTQRIQKHFHLHCIVPGGVWRSETRQWIPCRGKWLFRKDSLALAFRNRFLCRLQALRTSNKLLFTGCAAELHAENAWNALLAALQTENWIVYPKAAYNATLVLDYLGRYTHKAAISDHRIKSLANGLVTYSWRDRQDDNREKLVTIPAQEFIRRFLHHILPNGFQKIRHYGWLSSASKEKTLADIRSALPAPAPPTPQKESLPDRILCLTGHDIRLCPICGKGRLQKTETIILPARGPP